MRLFKIEDSPSSSTGLKCIRANDMTSHECSLVRGIVTNNWMPGNDSKLGHAAGVFLQGFQPPMNETEADGFVMVEFWCRDVNAIMAFVKHLETELQLDAEARAAIPPVRG